jgi:hypothetical protein
MREQGASHELAVVRAEAAIFPQSPPATLRDYPHRGRARLEMA